MMRFTRLTIPVAALSLVLTSGVGIARAGNHYGQDKAHGSGASSVPELSVGAAGSALLLLIGGTLVARARRRRGDKK